MGRYTFRAGALVACSVLLGCDGREPPTLGPNIGDRDLTSAGQRYRDDPATSTDVLEEIASRGEPSDHDLVLSMTIYAIVVHAEQTGRVSPLLSDPGFLADVDVFADRYPEIVTARGDTGRSESGLIRDPDHEFGCGPTSCPDCVVGACDIDYAVLAPSALGVVAGIGSVPRVISNPTVVTLVARVGDWSEGWDATTWAREASFDRDTFVDAAILVAQVTSAAVVAGTTGPLAVAAGVIGALIGIHQLVSAYHDLLTAQLVCRDFQARHCRGRDGGVVPSDAAASDAGPVDGGPCPFSATAIVCGEPPICLEPSSNHMHCGGCDRVCSSGSCVDGSCECPSAGQIDCPGIGCIDVQADRSNCGSCGNTCAIDEECAGGRCSSPCGNGTCDRGEFWENCEVDCGSFSACARPGQWKPEGDWIWDEYLRLHWQNFDAGVVLMETDTQNLGVGHEAYCASLGAEVPNWEMFRTLIYNVCPTGIDPVFTSFIDTRPILSTDACMGWPATRREGWIFEPGGPRNTCERFTSEVEHTVRCVRRM